jgi:hypothetical protein
VHLSRCSAVLPPAGTYAPFKGTNTSCTPAPAGSYAAGPGNTYPTPCAMGSYQPDPGSTACLDCPGGSLNLGLQETHSTGGPVNLQETHGTSASTGRPVDLHVTP